MTDDKAPGTFTFDDAPKKRGRPAGSTNKPKSASAPTQTEISRDVKQALATLDSLYNMVSTGLMVGGFGETFGVWSQQAELLRAKNEDALRAAPKLAAWIARTGSTGGTATFLIAHGMAAFAVAGTLRGELADRRAQAQGPSQDGEQGFSVHAV